MSEGSENSRLVGLPVEGEKVGGDMAYSDRQSESSITKRNTFSDVEGNPLYTTGSRIDDSLVDNLLQQRLHSTRASDLESQMSAPVG